MKDELSFFETLAVLLLMGMIPCFACAGAWVVLAPTGLLGIILALVVCVVLYVSIFLFEVFLLFWLYK